MTYTPENIQNMPQNLEKKLWNISNSHFLSFSAPLCQCSLIESQENKEKPITLTAYSRNSYFSDFKMVITFPSFVFKAHSLKAM